MDFKKHYNVEFVNKWKSSSEYLCHLDTHRHVGETKAELKDNSVVLTAAGRTGPSVSDLGWDVGPTVTLAAYGEEQKQWIFSCF